jgi:hypothetical protein
MSATRSKEWPRWRNVGVGGRHLPDARAANSPFNSENVTRMDSQRGCFTAGSLSELVGTLRHLKSVAEGRRVFNSRNRKSPDLGYVRTGPCLPSSRSAIASSNGIGSGIRQRDRGSVRSAGRVRNLYVVVGRAGSKTTLNLYTQAISEQKRSAQSSVVRLVLPLAKSGENQETGHFWTGTKS